MVRRNAPAPPKRRANLSPEQMHAAVRLLDRREADLRGFNLDLVIGHGDQSAESLRIKYNATIAKIFGEDTQDYEQYSSWAFDRGPVYMDSGWGGGSGVNLAEVRNGYRQGIDEALMHVATIRDLFAEDLEDFDDDPAARITRAFGELDIHPSIADAAGQLVEDGYYANAVEDACKALEALVQHRSDRPALSGADLMQTVFSANAPILKVADLATQTGRDTQKGMMYLFAGAMLGLRNPRAHSLKPDDPEQAIDYIAFLSMLAKVADAATL